MAGTKPSPASAGLNGSHEKIRERLLNNLPARGDRVLTITVDEILALLSDYHLLLGRLEGVLEGAERLKAEIRSRK